jgi:hypothetical protein
MNPSKLTLIAALFLISCSASDNVFDEKKHVSILPGFDYQIDKNTLYLQDDIYDSDGKHVYLDDLSDNGCLQDFFWIVNSDTIRKFWVEKEMPYGEHFVKLFIMDIFGDTASFSDSVWVKEPFSINLLSPVNNFSDLSKGDTVHFEYKTNGFNEDEPRIYEPKIYTCAIGNCRRPVCNDNDWIELKGKALELEGHIFWKVEVSVASIPEIIIASSEIRSICPKI